MRGRSSAAEISTAGCSGWPRRAIAWLSALPIVAMLALAACHAPPQAAGPARHGRYSGIGIFTPGPLWAALAQAGVPADAKGATVADDDAIIVVVDGVTGEVRECGNLSGVCVKLDPWSKAIATSASAPLTLSKHAGPAKDGPIPTLNKADSEVMPLDK